jgi:ADP-heptose:LPS heptosyltransferase
MHYTDFIAAQLARAQVPLVDEDGLAWLDGSLDAFDLPERFALLIPGCSPQRLYKRWPPASYAALAERFAKRGIGCLMIGTNAEAETLAAITASAPFVRNLGGQTSLGQIAALARRAICVVGNDTGPTHIAAATGAPTLSLIAANLNPVWSCPKGPRSAWLGAAPLADLAVEAVWEKVAVLAALAA